MGCCMCDVGCDHSSETSSSCSYPPSSPQPLGENPGAIAGIAVGAAVLVILVLGFGIRMYLKKKKAAPAKGGNV